MRRALATLVLAAASPVHAAPVHAECHLGILATLPITMQGLRPTTVARINGTDAPFLVDSGAFFGIITPGTAKQFALHQTPAPVGFTMGGIGGATTPTVTTVRKFGIAGQTLDNIPFLVGGSEVGQDSVGVIGYNVLGIGDAEYDLAHGVVRLIRPAGCRRANFPYWPHPAVVASEVDLEPGIGGRTSRIATTATINGTKVRAVFDTGAAGSVVSRAAALRAGIDVTGPDARPAGVTSGVGRRAVRSWTVPVAVFKIGDEEVRTTFLRVIEAIGEGPEAPEMLIGADFFLSHHIYVAKDLHKLYFTYNGGNVFNLKAVDAPPPAEAPTADAGTTAPPPDEPKTAEEIARRGAAFAARRDYGRAIADLTRAVALAPDEPRYLAERAQAYAGNRQPYLAMADLDAVLGLRPGDVPALMQRAGARAAGRDRAGALADLAAAAAAAPPEADVRFAIGALDERLDDLPAAIAQYDLWLKVHRDDVKAAAAYNARGRARALLGTDLDLAEKDCAAAHRLDAANVFYLDSRGLVRLRRGEFVHAIADYDAVLARNPKVAWSLYGRGIAKLQTGATAEGTADLAAARAIAPNLAAVAHAHGIDPPAAAP